MSSHILPVIGILSGIDQKSCASLIDTFLKEYEKPFLTKGEVEIPRILTHALPVNNTESAPKNQETIKKDLLSALALLEKSGATFIILNSYIAHVHLESLRAATSLPILDMITLSMAQIAKAPYKVAILGTRTTIATQLFQQALTKKGSEGIMPPYWQTHVDAMLKKIRVGISAQTEFNWLLGRIKSSGITTIIVASTDLSKVASKATGFTIIDCTRVLAQEAVRVCRP